MFQPIKQTIIHLSKKETTRAIALLTLFIVVFFFDVIFINKTLLSIQVPGVMGGGPYGHSGRYSHRALIDPGGSTWGPRPHNQLVSQQYKKGIFPLWNPFMGTGQPLAGNMDSNAFNPLRILLYINPSPFMWDMFLLIRLLLAGSFTYLFMKTIKISQLTSIFSAVLFMFCGYFIFSIDMHHLDVEIFLPFLFLCFEKIIQKNSMIKWGVLSSIAVFFTIVGGQPQSAFLVLSFSSIYYFFRIIFFRENWIFKNSGSLILAFIFINLVGFALSAILLFPFYEFWQLSWNNHDPRLGYILGLSYNPFFSDMISFFIPYYFGPIHGSWLKEYNWHILTRGYWGVTAILFSFAALMQSFKIKSNRKYFVWFFSICLTLLVAKLYGFPLINWIGKLPIANMINYGKYMGPLMGFCAAILAGYGMEFISNSEKESENLKRSAQILILVIVCTFFYFYKYMMDHSERFDHFFDIYSIFSYPIRNSVLAQIAMAIFFMGILLIVYSHYSKERKFGSKEFKIILIALALMELFFYIPNPGILKHRNDRYDIFQKAPYIDFLNTNLKGHRVIAIDRILYPDFGSAFEIGDLRVLDALVVKRYMEFVREFFPLPQPPDRFTGDEGIDFKNENAKKILNLLGVKYILTSAELKASGLIDAILKSGRVVSTPSPSVSQWINASTLNINGIERKVLFEHPPARIEYAMRIPLNASLDFSIGLVPEAWSPDKGDGVLYEIYLIHKDNQKIIFSRYIDPKNNVRDRKWFDFSLDLGPYAGEDAILSFVTLPGIGGKKDNNCDWSVWGNIQVVLKDDIKDAIFKLVYDREIKIYENANVFPRVFIANDYEVIRDKGNIFSALKNKHFDLKNKIILEEDVPDEIRSTMMQIPKNKLSYAEIKNFQANTIEIVAHMQSPGFLVLSDTYYPGWIAYVNGQKRKIFVADYLLRSVFLEPGIHTVAFVYEPFSFKLGALISFFTLISIMAALIFKGVLRNCFRNS